jgi:teichuronic acid biosynthesis glycosyltransferase TuaC
VKILVISNMYPDRNHKYPYAGTFVKEQVEALSAMACVDVHVIEGFRGIAHYIRGFLVAWWFCLRGSYDVIHVHYGLTAAFIAWLPERVKRKVVVTLHGGDILAAQGLPVQVAITRRSIMHAGLVLGVSDEIAQAARPYAQQVIVLPCGVDDDFFMPASSTNRTSPITVIFPGDPARAVKNYPLFAAVMEAFQQLYGPVSVVVLHQLTREQVRNAMQTGSAILMTSLSEGSPQVIKEALACDLAVVSSDVGDVQTMLHGVAGTATFLRQSSPTEIAHLLHTCIEQVRASPGARRNRIAACGMSNRQIVDRLVDSYALLCPER